MEESIFLGSHISLAAPQYFLSSAKEAFDYGENCFMFYTGAPQNSKRIPLERLYIEEGKAFCQSNGIFLDKCVIHAPYIINLANNENPSSFEFGKEFLKEEITRCKAFSIPYLVLHPGSRKDMELEESIRCLALALKEVIEPNSEIKICIETMAGKGKEIGRTFEEVASILRLVDDPLHVGVCLDTCHIHDAGYDITDIDSLLEEFDSKIGLDNLHVIHLNDSKNEKGSHKDRHENIGYGMIGYKMLKDILFHPRLREIPKILETPWVNGLPPYKKEIEMLKGDFIEDWKDSI
ncbi:MAG: deoxyribonuclease IV [Bacilli bacterium]|nr:deoxyribonuclease IV [Bacilli bacterium]